jgi:N-acetylneuraminic acid mutarotase
MLLPSLNYHSLAHLNSPVGRIKVKKRAITMSNTESVLFAARTAEARRAAVTTQPDEFITEMLKRAEKNSDPSHIASVARMIKPLEVYWLERSIQGNLPEAREGASMVAINRRIFLFGGLSRGLFNDVRVLRADNWTWSQMAIDQNSELPQARIGHSMVAYRHKFIVYGGCGLFDKTLRIRQCFSRVHVFDTERGLWSTYKPLGETPEARRNHAAVIIGSSVLIYGGVNSNGKLLHDMQILNVETMNWLTPKVTADDVKPGKLAYFTITAVFPAAVRTRADFDIFHIPMSQDDVFNSKNSGVYLFGGVDRNGKARNDLFVLRIKRFKAQSDGLFRWTKLTPVGRPPQARYSHTTTLVTKYLFIVGGRTSDITPLGDYDVTEIAALNIEACRWEIVNIYGSYPGGRWSACSSCLGSTLLYFGGMRLEKYSKSKMYVMEADPYNVGAMIAREAEALK